MALRQLRGRHTVEIQRERPDWFCSGTGLAEAPGETPEQVEGLADRMLAKARNMGDR